MVVPVRVFQVVYVVNKIFEVVKFKILLANAFVQQFSNFVRGDTGSALHFCKYRKREIGGVGGPDFDRANGPEPLKLRSLLINIAATPPFL
jgi:hypothetical protein